ncbi:MAG: hypothetical protein L6R37_006101 [Teloschistes peruensis]|nr:MAG: hypothetical protein L6R37_006101 [Teloschistes peruensis]
MILSKPRKRTLFLIISACAVFAVVANFFVFLGLTDADIRSQFSRISFPRIHRKPWHSDDKIEGPYEARDAHPISVLMAEADKNWLAYENSRSTTFRQTVSEYRRKYGRHPPPDFKEWYDFARKKNVHNIDDFEQVMDDLRPFWAIEPKVIRNLAANMWRNGQDGVAGIHIRDHKVVKETNESWRSKTLVTLIRKFVNHLPDMDIAMNRLDQPRVVVPWEDMQAHLKQELQTRRMMPEANDTFTTGQSDLLNLTSDEQPPHKEDPQWFPAHGKQYMDTARLACPPESHARSSNMPKADAESKYKNRLGGVITNFNLSSDLCTAGPEIQDQHGFLYAGSTVIPTKRLVPIFGECKVNINSDILFPANMYWMHDERYDYDEKHDNLDWEKKQDSMIWRGVTSGGTQTADNWKKMHRQRLVQKVNSTEMADELVRIVTEQPEKDGEFENFRHFHPASFAANHTDVGFTEPIACVPDCSFYNDIFAMKPQAPFPQQFQQKFLVDVDGHSFSGRWHAFLESKSLGIKATIFREWHDSRLFAWRHFVPMDNRYDDIYTILTYFLGVGERQAVVAAGPGNDAFVARHEEEGKRIAVKGREWAKKVLRREDIEIYTFRLLLEYARIIDDNRDRIGYSGDGSEFDKYDGVAKVDEVAHRLL